MKKTLLALSLAFALLTVFSGCKVTQTEEGALPDVDVKVEGGNIPKYDVDAPHVDVGTKEVTVEVPDINVTTPDDPDYQDDDGGGDGNN